MTDRSDAQAVLFTGVYGTGKTSMSRSSPTSWRTVAISSSRTTGRSARSRSWWCPRSVGTRRERATMGHRRARSWHRAGLHVHTERRGAQAGDGWGILGHGGRRCSSRAARACRVCGDGLAGGSARCDRARRRARRRAHLDRRCPGPTRCAPKCSGSWVHPPSTPPMSRSARAIVSSSSSSRSRRARPPPKARSPHGRLVRDRISSEP